MLALYGETLMDALYRSLTDYTSVYVKQFKSSVRNVK